MGKTSVAGIKDGNAKRVAVRILDDTTRDSLHDFAESHRAKGAMVTLERAHEGVHHQLLIKHLQRCVSQFAGRHNVRDMDTLEQMQHVLAGMVGRRLLSKVPGLGRGVRLDEHTAWSLSSRR